MSDDALRFTKIGQWNKKSRYIKQENKEEEEQF